MDTALPGRDSSLLDFFERVFLLENLNLKAGHEVNYRVAIRHFGEYLKRPPMLTDFSETHILGFIRHLQARGDQSSRTINNKRASIKTLWKRAHQKFKPDIPAPGVIGKLNEPKRIVRAWSVSQVTRIIEFSAHAPPIRHWDGRHWKFLILLIYDTGHRLRALMQTPKTALGIDGYLLVRAEHSKGNIDTLHKLGPDTIAAWKALPENKSGKLIDWPISVKEIWPRFKEILTAADLPASRRDLFHRLRRTSYTYVYALLGPHAASDHAAHTTDLSRSYLDITLMNEIKNLPSAIDVLPRPNPR